jgi:CBS domain-containing protein/gamma-glutamyl:cysteine ligase YbdK (ATP-grasp superfamily)
MLSRKRVFAISHTHAPCGFFRESLIFSHRSPPRENALQRSLQQSRAFHIGLERHGGCGLRCRLMGDKKVTREYGDSEMREFTLAVLNDLEALETMLADGMIESDIRRIGAEQEMFLIDNAMRPAPVVEELIAAAGDPRLTTEIGRFNLEANLAPLEFKTDCLTRLEKELYDVLGSVRRAAKSLGADIVLAGILPTIQPSDLTEKNLTPNPRYFEINRVVSELHGDNRFIQIKGLDELQVILQDTFVEFCNTSFQVHFQVGAPEFANVYNWSQALAAPVLASAVNSPLLLNNRLWHETRIALFQHATDTRSPIHQLRHQPPRVNFGNRWVEGSIIDNLRNDAVRYRVLLAQAIGGNSTDELAAGRIPRLRAWRLHNGTIWRWNRACYGITNGKPGLRIEARYLPAGPSIADEMANAAFLLGLLVAAPNELGNVAERMPFDAVKNNFYNAARYGLDSQICWLDGKCRPAAKLILDELLPLAWAGLKEAQIDVGDIDRFLGIIEERVCQRKTGAAWMLQSLEQMDPLAKQNVRMRSLTAAMKTNQESGLPLHKWELANIPPSTDWIDNYKSVEQFMATDLFTVRPDDVLDLAASLMEWRHVRHVPVEDDSGKLVGLISHRDLIHLYARGGANGQHNIPVRDVMKTDLVTIDAGTPTLDALNLMRKKNIGALPVVSFGKLVGLVTAYDFLTVSTKLFEERLKQVI